MHPGRHNQHCMESRWGPHCTACLQGSSSGWKQHQLRVCDGLCFLSTMLIEHAGHIWEHSDDDACKMHLYGRLLTCSKPRRGWSLHKFGRAYVYFRCPFDLSSGCQPNPYQVIFRTVDIWLLVLPSLGGQAGQVIKMSQVWGTLLWYALCEVHAMGLDSRKSSLDPR